VPQEPKAPASPTGRGKRQATATSPRKARNRAMKVQYNMGGGKCCLTPLATLSMMQRGRVATHPEKEQSQERTRQIRDLAE